MRLTGDFIKAHDSGITRLHACVFQSTEPVPGASVIASIIKPDVDTSIADFRFGHIRPGSQAYGPWCMLTTIDVRDEYELWIVGGSTSRMRTVASSVRGAVMLHTFGFGCSAALLRHTSEESRITFHYRDQEETVIRYPDGKTHRLGFTLSA